VFQHRYATGCRFHQRAWPGLEQTLVIAADLPFSSTTMPGAQSALHRVTQHLHHPYVFRQQAAWSARLRKTARRSPPAFLMPMPRASLVRGREEEGDAFGWLAAGRPIR
jgi:hypothetical protein